MTLFRRKLTWMAEPVAFAPVSLTLAYAQPGSAAHLSTKKSTEDQP
jgi:hypothetical protein